MSILWRFMWCIAAIAWAGSSVANPVSGAYLNQGKGFVELLQITARSDGSLEGTLTRNALQVDGSLSQKSTPLTGVVDGHAITIMVKPILQPTSLSGTFNGEASGKGVIALALPDKVVRYTESNLDEYQSALLSLKKSSEAIRKQRRTGYAEKVRTCIQPRIIYPVPPRRESGLNPEVSYRANLSPQGLVESVLLKLSSGIPGFDVAVVAAIKGCSPFPRPPSGEYPSYVEGSYRMYD